MSRLVKSPSDNAHNNKGGAGAEICRSAGEMLIVRRFISTAGWRWARLAPAYDIVVAQTTAIAGIVGFIAAGSIAIV
jgi:hypothetical protein